MTEEQVDESAKKGKIFCLKTNKIPWYTWIILAGIFFLVFKPILLVVYKMKNKSNSDACSVREMKYNMPDSQQDMLPDIYFLDSKCGNRLLPYQACAIESACLHNPWATVALKTLGKFFDPNEKYTNVLKKYSNFRLFPLRAFERASGTALNTWLIEGNWENHNVLHFKYAMAYLELYVNGGIYIGMDTVTLKSLEAFKNNGTVGKFNETILKLSFLGASKTRSRVWRDALTYFQETDWEEGSGFVTDGRLLADVLTSLGCKEYVKEGGFCEKETMVVMPQEYFYPLQESGWPYQTKDVDMEELKRNSYLLYLWNVNKGVAFSGNDSLYNALAKEHCPKVYEASVSPGT